MAKSVCLAVSSLTLLLLDGCSPSHRRAVHALRAQTWNVRHYGGADSPLVLAAQADAKAVHILQQPTP